MQRVPETHTQKERERERQDEREVCRPAEDSPCLQLSTD